MGLLFLMACAPKTTIRVMKPAAVDVSGIKRMAVLDFRGPENSGLLAASLFTSKLWQTGFYTLVERNELQRILEEQSLSLSGVIDNQQAVQIGKLLGVDAIIVGEVLAYSAEDNTRTRKVKKRVWTGEYERDKDGNIIYEKTIFGIKVKKKKYREVWVDEEVVERQATVSVSFRLVDVETGRIRASHTRTHSFSESAVSGEEELPPREQILNQLLEKCIDDFVRLITPHYVTITTRFARGNAEVNRGIELAKNGLWDKAQQVWEGVVARDPANHAAWYNLALAYEAQGMYQKAEQALNRAIDLKSDRLYIDALKRVRSEIADQQRLQQQLREREPETAGGDR